MSQGQGLAQSSVSELKSHSVGNQLPRSLRVGRIHFLVAVRLRTASCWLSTGSHTYFPQASYSHGVTAHPSPLPYSIVWNPVTGPTLTQGQGVITQECEHQAVGIVEVIPESICHPWQDLRPGLSTLSHHLGGWMWPQRTLGPAVGLIWPPHAEFWMGSALPSNPSASPKAIFTPVLLHLPPSAHIHLSVFLVSAIDCLILSSLRESARIQ